MNKPAIALTAALVWLLPGAAGAQQLKQSTTQPNTPIGSTSSSSGNTLQPPNATPNRSVSSDPAQRSVAPLISSKGPAKDANKPEQAASVQPKTSTAPTPVTDARGRIVSGAVQVGPNRVMDPKTGRYYTTMPNGDGQRIIEPPKK